MKKILLTNSFVIFFALGAWACSGDCLSCHPTLAKNILSDERHKPMLTCKKCHMNEEAGMSECGKDCFACHAIEKIDKSVTEHQVIEKCRNCHMKMPATLEVTPKTSNEGGTMYDLLLN
jgi:uncharacterized membrane protein